MNNIMDLREKRTKTWEMAKSFLDTRRTESGVLVAEDEATYDKMEADVVKLGKEIARLERQDAIEREMAQATSTPLSGKPATGATSDEPKGRAAKTYKKAFWDMMRIKTSDSAVYNALQIGTDTEGGYLVPDEFERTLVEALEEENIFRQLATTITTSSGDRKIPVVSSKGTASWVDEEGLIPESDDSFGQVSISAYKLATMIKISEELLSDSAFNLESYIAKEFGRRIGAKEEEAFFVGNGTGKPVGIFDAASGAETSITTNSATAITFDEAMDLFYSLHAPYRKKAVFLMNDSTVKAFRKLKDNSGQYLWSPSLTAGAPDTILNRPIFTSSNVPVLEAGAKGIAFGDFSYYWIADRQGRTFQRLNELYAATGQVGFKASERVDGRLILPEAVKLLQMKLA